ncbi:MAG TPA: anti-sigma factor [Allosphingosinicella sp.]|jgi:hypothetical protein
MMAIDDDQLMAFVDGELDDLARARVERALAEDSALQARLDVQRRLRARLAAHYAPVMDEAVPDRLSAVIAGNVVPLSAARPWHTRPVWRNLAALAATLVLGLVVGRTLPQGGEGPLTYRDGAIVARGGLADALDSQLASAQAQDAATRIGISFAANGGGICRTFERSDLAGLACRRGDGWQLVMTGAGSPAAGGAYRQAASGNPLILEAAQDLMTGAPLDAAAERRARDAGWQIVP